jgi:hypothetical protein
MIRNARTSAGFFMASEIRLTKGAVPKELMPGMRFKGIRQDDRTIGT